MTETKPKKILLVGNGGVGKTTFLNVLTGKGFDPKYKATERIESYRFEGKEWNDFPGQYYTGIIPDQDFDEYWIFKREASKIDSFNKWKSLLKEWYQDLDESKISCYLTCCENLPRGHVFKIS